MTKAYRCDKCKEFFVIEPRTKHMPNRYGGTTEIHLCDNCTPEYDSMITKLNDTFRK
jgi:hypothetical protein